MSPQQPPKEGEHGNVGLHYLGGAFDPEHMRDLANMATLPSMRYLIQQIDGFVILSELGTEREIVRIDLTDNDTAVVNAAKAQKIIHDSGLSAEDKSFAHFWSGYFYAHSGITDPETDLRDRAPNRGALAGMPSGERYRNALAWVRHVAGLHYLGGAFDPEHMRDLANLATAALQGKDLPDYGKSMAESREKAAEWAALFGALADGGDDEQDGEDDGPDGREPEAAESAGADPERS